MELDGDSEVFLDFFFPPSSKGLAREENQSEECWD